MNKLLHVLIVEDSEDDCFLLIRELKRGGYEPVYERVDTPEAMTEALEKKYWEIVISDYVLPKFGGFAALGLLKKSGLDLPFIIVSGNIGEDVAVEAMRAGAQDYIIKGNMARLIPAVERELRDAATRRERRLVEESLRESEKQYRLLFDNSIDGILLTSADGGILAANPAICRMVGRDEEGIRNAGQAGIMDMNDPAVAAFLEERKLTGQGRAEVPVLRADGTKFPTEQTSVRFRDKDGNVITSTIIRDITERRETEERTRIINELLKLYARSFSRQAYLDAAISLIRTWSGFRHAGMRVADDEGNIPYVSCEGFTPGFQESEGALSMERDHCACTRVVAGEPEPQDLPAMTPNGSFYCNNSVQFLNGMTGEQKARFRGACIGTGFLTIVIIPIRYRDKILGAIHLADEREEMAPVGKVEFLEHVAFIIGEVLFRFGMEGERAQLTSALESAAEAVVVTDSKGYIRYVNAAFGQITGYEKDEVMGGTLHVLDSGKHDQRFFADVRESIKRDGVWRGRLWNKKKDGTLYLEDCTYSPVRDAAGAIINYISVKRDVTENVRLESIAESVNMMNNIGYIFSGVRHEIGNPINSAKMILSVLQYKMEQPSDGQKTVSPEFIQSYVERAISEIGRVELLLKSLKNYNLYETMDMQHLSMSEFLDGFMNLIIDDFERKNIAVLRTIEPGADWAYADPRALQQVLINIVTNAVDAVAGRNDPSISITVGKQSDKIVIRVRDNGRGMTEKQKEDLFKPFYTSKQHGTGLGLVIVKKMMTRMGGDIEIASRQDEGTTVAITMAEGRA